MRNDLEAFVNQKEWETSQAGDNDGKGRIPAAFLTFTTAIYKWERLNRLIRRFRGLPETVPGETIAAKKERMFQDAVNYPAIVAWCQLGGSAGSKLAIPGQLDVPTSETQRFISE